jgi:hypothetical protein
MIKLADRGDLEREDTDCGILYGILRDSAYKLKRLAETEKAKHIAKGKWEHYRFQPKPSKIPNIRRR